MIKSTKWIGAALMIFVCHGAAHAQQPKPAGPTQDLSSVATEDLITKLQNESSPGIGTHETAWASGFMAINDEPKFNGGIIGSAKPVISPVVRELVRRGTAQKAAAAPGNNCIIMLDFYHALVSYDQVPPDPDLSNSRLSASYFTFR